MNKDRELMQQALEALETNQYAVAEAAPHRYVMAYNDAITALRERLAQPEQEPFGYVSEHNCEGPYQFQFHLDQRSVYPDNCKSITPVYTTPQPEQEPYGWVGESSGQFIKNVGQRFVNGKALYTTPPRREWVGLTEEDFSAINQSCLTKLQAAISAESILKEKNA